MNPERNTDGLMQERRNSSAFVMGYVFLGLTHRYINFTYKHVTGTLYKQ